MNPLARIDEERHGDVVVARVVGEVDASNATWVGTRMRALLTNRSVTLTVDLTETAYLDSAGIALLFGLADELRTHQQQLRLVVAEGSSISRMIELSGLDKTVSTHPDLPDALGERPANGSPA